MLQQLTVGIISSKFQMFLQNFVHCCVWCVGQHATLVWAHCDYVGSALFFLNFFFCNPVLTILFPTPLP